MSSRIALTQSTINENCIYISSEHTTFCHVFAFSMSNFPLREALAELKSFARANKVQLSGSMRIASDIEALLLELPAAVAERQDLFNQLATGWQKKLDNGLHYGCAVYDDEYTALTEVLGRFSKTTHRNTVLGRAIDLISKLQDGLKVRPHSKIFL